MKRPKDQEAKPVFSFDKVKALGKALRQDAEENAATETKESKTCRKAIRSLLLTGFRRMEGLTLKWQLLDSDAHCVRFEVTKSGKQMRAIGRSALDHFANFKPNKTKPSDYIFLGSSKTRHLVGLPKIWERIAKSAGISMGQGACHFGLGAWLVRARCLVNTATTISRAWSKTDFCSSAETSTKPNPRSRKIPSTARSA
jgi:integrase